jgi:uncharacterized integral membrane protein
MKPKTIVLLILALIVLIIIVQNSQVVMLRLLFWKVHMSQVIFTPLLLLIGFIAGFIAAKLTGTKKAPETAPAAPDKSQ